MTREIVIVEDEGIAPDTAVPLSLFKDLVAALNQELARFENAPRLEFGRGKENTLLYLRHANGSVTVRNVRGPRGRQGRRGRTGPMPRHQWNPERNRVRFELAPDQWGPWSDDLSR